MDNLTRTTKRDPAAGVFYDEIQVEEEQITTEPKSTPTSNTKMVYAGTFAILPQNQHSSTSKKQDTTQPAVKPYFSIVQGSALTNPAIDALNKLVAFFRGSTKQINPK